MHTSSHGKYQCGGCKKEYETMSAYKAHYKNFCYHLTQGDPEQVPNTTSQEVLAQAMEASGVVEMEGVEEGEGEEDEDVVMNPMALQLRYSELKGEPEDFLTLDNDDGRDNRDFLSQS